MGAGSLNHTDPFSKLQGMQVVDQAMFVPVGAHLQDTTVSAVTTLEAPAGAGRLLIQATGQNVRYTLDGTAPTGTKGFRLVASAAPTLLLVPIGGVVKVIEEAASATIDYQWGRKGIAH